MATFPPSTTSSDLLGPDDLVSKLERLPSSAQVLPKVMDILEDENASMDSVTSVISMDQGVSAGVFQLSNSAYYSKGERSYSIHEAVSRVGMLKVYELVANAVASRLLLRDLTTYGIDADKLWRLSFTCALAAEKIALRIGQEGAFSYTAGLFHMTGLMAIDVWNAETEKKLKMPSGTFPDESVGEEKRILGFTNASVAAALLRRWSFHSRVVEPIRWQYLPRNAGSHIKLASVLHIAKWVRDAAHLEAGASLPKAPEGSVLAAVGFPAADLESLAVEVKSDYDNAVELLSNIDGD